jgi:glycosyltransferase involved in cell wall biosynthesis
MVAACDVGCLLSLAEAGGMSLREFCRLGIPTIAPLTGGSPEQVVEGATHLVAPDAPDAEIADILLRLATKPGLLARQKEIAWRERKAADWDRSVAQIGNIIGRPATHPMAV